MRRSGTSTIGVIVPRLTDTVMAMLYEEIAAAAAARGLFAVVATTQDRPEAERVAVQSLLHRRVDGIIRATARTGSPLRIDGDARQVLVLRTDGIHPASIGDDHLGGYLATRKLIDHGHHRIGLIMGPEYATTAVQRRAGYRAALTEAGIPLDDSLIAGDAYTMEAGEAAAQHPARPPRSAHRDLRRQRQQRHRRHGHRRRPRPASSPTTCRSSATTTSPSSAAYPSR